MSGGELTDHEYDLYKLDEWANRLEKHNTLLAEQMRDMSKLLDRYDYYFSGDIGTDSLEEAWAEYRDKWIKMDSETVESILFEKCLEMVNGAIKGCTERDDWR